LSLCFCVSLSVFQSLSMCVLLDGKKKCIFFSQVFDKDCFKIGLVKYIREARHRKPEPRSELPVQVITGASTR